MKRKLLFCLCLLLLLAASLTLTACDEGGSTPPAENPPAEDAAPDDGGEDDETPAEKIPLTGITFEDATFIYDGTEKSIAIKGTLPEGVSVTYAGNNKKAAGTHTVTAVFSDTTGKYELPAYLSATLTIVKDGSYCDVLFKDSTNNVLSFFAVPYGEAVPQDKIPAVPAATGYDGKWNYEGAAITADTVIAPVYTLHTYTVTYALGNEANDSRNPQTFTIESATLPLYPTAGSHGHTFVGWYTTQNFSEGSRIESIAKGTHSDLVLYPKFVDYRIENATGFAIDTAATPITLTAQVANAVTTLDLTELIEVSAGSTWVLTQSEGGTAIADKTLTLTTGHNIAYITVTKGEYSLTYKLDVYRLSMLEYSFVADGTTVAGPTEVEEGSTVSAPATNPEKAGHTFAGWSIALGDDTTVTFPYTVTEGLVFYAVFTPNTYHYSFNVNGGNPIEGSTEGDIAFGSSLAMPQPTKTGHTFGGWQDEEGHIYTTSPLTWEFVGDMSFTAVWTANPYTITYDPNGGTMAEGTEQDVTYGDEYTLREPARTGYIFCGYTLDGQPFTKGQVYTYDRDITLVAVWKDAFAYAMSNGKATLTGYEGVDDHVIIPAFTVQGGVQYPVTAIGDYVFQSCTSITTVTIPASVTCIGSYAFYYCPKLMSVTFEGDSQLTSIGIYAFYYCQALASIKIPAKTISIGFYAFDCCVGIIDTENGVSYVDKWVIDCDENAASVSLRADTVGIADNAFSNCANLSSIDFPGNLISIGSNAFQNCTGLKNVILGNNSQLITIGFGAFRDCTGLMSITLPFVGERLDGTGRTYFGCIFGINSASGHSSLPTSLKTVAITGGTSIDENAFIYCQNITSITIPQGVVSIGAQAFKGCTSLTVINIPQSVTSIDAFAFNGCTSLTAVYITDLAAWCYIDFNEANPLYYAKNLYLNETLVTSLEIPNTVTEIKAYAFCGCTSITSVSIPASVMTIGEDAFWLCTELNIVRIADLIEWCNIDLATPYANPLSYAKNLYLNDTLVTSLEIPNAVTEIKAYAFFGCTSITSVTMSQNVTSIGMNAFAECTGLSAAYITDFAAWCNIDFADAMSNPLYYAKKLYLNNTLMTSLQIPNAVTEIKPYAFYNCTELTSITIPSEINTIGEYAFYNCTGLIAVHITDLASWCNIVFDGTFANPLYYAKKLYLNSDTFSGNVEIQNGVKQIPAYTFYGCKGITSITIPSSVTSIGDYAFYGCTGLERVSFGENSKLTSIGRLAFDYCTRLTSITIPSSVTIIDDAAFSDCTNLSSVNFGENSQLTTIGWSAFSHCTELMSITIPLSVTSIDSSAFSSCTNLSSVTFENTEGWWYASSSTATSGTSIASTDLEKTDTAATYLTSTYCDYYWKRS